MIHPTAIVDPSARIAPDATIGAYTIIGPDTTIGPKCIVGPHAVVEYTTLGEGCAVYPNACLGLPAQHLRYNNEPARLEVGKGTTFREGVTAHRGTPFDASVTRIGDNCFFMATSHIAHDCRVGNNVILANGAMLAGHVEVGDSAFVSAAVGVHQHGRIGKGAIVSGGAMVSLDIAPFCTAQGDRASLRGLNVVGMRRMGFDRQQIREIKEAFRVMFQAGLRAEEAFAHPELNTGSDAVTTFRDFLKGSKRGFARPLSGAAFEEAEAAS